MKTLILLALAMVACASTTKPKPTPCEAELRFDVAKFDECPKAESEKSK